MNPDLETRLRPFDSLHKDEKEFFTTLMEIFTWESFAPFHRQGLKPTVNIYIEPIENDEDDSAYMTGDDEYNFEIYLDERMPFGMVIDFALHEFAHILSWLAWEDDDHGPAFGIAYASLYRIYLQFYEDFWG